MTQRTRFGIGLVVAIAVGLGLLLWPGHTESLQLSVEALSDAGQARVNSASNVGGESTPLPVRSAPSAGSPSGAGHHVELLPVAPPPERAPRAVLGFAPPRPPTDKRLAPSARAKQELEILSYAFEALEEDVHECLSQWDALDAGATGEVMLLFELDAKGLQKTWVDSATEVPLGPRSCIANAVYGLDWANVVSEPAQLSERYTLDAAARKAVDGTNPPDERRP